MKSKFVYTKTENADAWMPENIFKYKRTLWQYADDYYCMKCGNKGIWLNYASVAYEVICVKCKHTMTAISSPVPSNDYYKGVISQVEDDSEFDIRDKIIEILDLSAFNYFGFEVTEENIKKIEDYFGVTIPDEYLHDDAIGEIAEYIEKELKADGRYSLFV